MSRNQLKKAILNHLRNKGGIHGRNPIGTLCDAVRVDGVQGKALVVAVLDELVKERQAGIRRSTNGMITSIYSVRPKKFIDRTEMSPQAKREHTFAKGIPAHLPDDWCTPVVVSHRESGEHAEEGESELGTNFVYIKGTPYHETLTMLMLALQAHADESGLCEQTSAAVVLQGVQNMTATTVRRAENYLRELDVYVVSKGSKPFTSAGYLIDMDREVISAEEVTACRRMFNKRYPRKSKSNRNDDTVQVVDEEELSVEEQMADIVVGLEAQVATLNEIILTMDEKLRAAESKLGNSISERDTALGDAAAMKKRIEELEAKLAAPPKIDPRIAEIIERHKK